jgi:hypothetical protein
VGVVEYRLLITKLQSMLVVLNAAARAVLRREQKSEAVTLFACVRVVRYDSPVPLFDLADIAIKSSKKFL